jgi:hypothetical protein
MYTPSHPYLLIAKILRPISSKSPSGQATAGPHTSLNTLLQQWTNSNSNSQCSHPSTASLSHPSAKQQIARSIAPPSLSQTNTVSSTSVLTTNVPSSPTSMRREKCQLDILRIMSGHVRGLLVVLGFGFWVFGGLRLRGLRLWRFGCGVNQRGRITERRCSRCDLGGVYVCKNRIFWRWD